MQEAERTIPTMIAEEIGCRPAQAAAAISLLDEGATVPFVARYRKEATGSLDDTQLRKLEDRLGHLRALARRREEIRSAIDAKGALTAEIGKRLDDASTKSELEDVYAPFRTRMKTRAQKAIEAGLEPLAERLLADQSADPVKEAGSYLGESVPDAKAALDGARDILADRFAANPETAPKLRKAVRPTARIRTRVVDGKEAEGEKFRDYFDHGEAWEKAPGHRVLAMLRGASAGFLTFDVEIDEDACVRARETIAADNGIRHGNAFLARVVDWAWRVKFANRLVTEMTAEARERAETEAIEVFARNLKALLMAAPAGMKVTMGLDPGIRTGVKVAVVDGTGRLLSTTTVHPFAPRNDEVGAIAELAALVRRHGVELIAIGNGTASRETDRLAGEVLRGLGARRPVKVVVSEAGASVYSASELAAREFPGLDVSLRGAVSIARRLQDPLAELVKIDPKSIGVGQYQHDVDQSRLARALSSAVEDVVNAVGVDLNTASPALLSHVSGLGPALAEAIVAHRDRRGAFRCRADLANVPRLGERAFSQSAGFLRIVGGDEPLDASAVHPEAYGVARDIVRACGGDFREVMGNAARLKRVDPRDFVTESFGLPTVRDVLAELGRPGRDPRPAFRTASFDDGIRGLDDLRPGMRLEGVVTNVAAFGAFVDVGVHQDGLVHVSQLADRFVEDPSAVVKAGDIVKVTVLSVDPRARRISLSMKSRSVAGEGSGRAKERGRGGGGSSRGGGKPATGALGDALLRAMGK